jgi:hypothetical protein
VGGQPPWAPPLVELTGGIVGHLLASERHERDGSWWAWLSWVQESGGRHVHKVVRVRAAACARWCRLRPITRCRDGCSATTGAAGLAESPLRAAPVRAAGVAPRGAEPKRLQFQAYSGFARGRV